MEGELFSGVSAQGMVDRLCELAVERMCMQSRCQRVGASA